MHRLPRASQSTTLEAPAPIVRRALWSAALIAGLALPLATAGGAAAQDAEESTAITTLYTSLLSGVGKGVGSESVGWAMSAMGLSGGDSGQLAAINAELQQIDADLKNINATLNEILDAIEEQTCTQTQIASSLQDAVNDITELYNEYQTYLVNAARTPPVPPSQTQALAWQSDVLSRVPGDLNALHNAVYATVNANVIDACAKATASSYLTAAKTAETFFDDRPSYSQLVDIVNYYYGVHVQGTTILVEAYHLQACQAAAQDDPDLHCDFATVSASTSAADADTICDAPTDIDVQRPCLEAEEAVTNPGTLTALYERVEAWLTAAGAPYATDQLGIISSVASSSSGVGPSSWTGSYAYLFPRDLLDFTNNVTVNGETIADCAAPLTSKAPCGPVGPYDAQFEAGMSYGGINGHWKAVTADVLLLLFEPYNDKSSGGFDSSGTAGDFMYSIGFSEAAKENGLIVTTANTGKNGDTGLATICFMDTAAPRDKAKQPWCDDNSLPSGTHQGTDNLIDTSHQDWVQSAYLDDITSQPAFYDFYRNSKGEFEELPGWTVTVQQQASSASDRAINWQYHWPITDVSEIGCQNGKPAVNPGGLLTRCAGDLQEYVDALLSPPDGDTTALATSGDATLRRDEPNRNTGEDPLLTLGGRGGEEFVVQFDDERVQRFWEGGEVPVATLRLSIAERGAPWRLELVPVFDGFVEGKGSVGSGATWNCAEDADLSDDDEDCLQHWPRSLFLPSEGRWPDRHDPRAGLVSWDVTEDVGAGAHAWLIRTPARHGHNWLFQASGGRGGGAGHGHAGGHRPARGGAYHSREGAAELREPIRAPTLLLAR